MSETRGAPRHRTGLRNKRRGGRGPYHQLRKSRQADRYGRYANGIQQSPDQIRKDTP